MSDTTISSVVVAHISEIESAIRYIQRVADPRLLEAAALRVSQICKRFDWTYEVSDDFSSTPWFAPPEWRIADDTSGAFDLYVNFEGTECLDGTDPETWIGQFLGFGGAGMCLSLGSNLLGTKAWKSFLRSESELINRLVTVGFSCDAKSGTLTLAVPIEKTALIKAFDDDDFSTALLPIEAAISQTQTIKPLLDMIVAKIRDRA